MAVVIAATAGGTFILLSREGGEGEQSSARLPPATAQVTRQTLHDTKTISGSLGYGPTTSLVNRLSGTVTWVPGSGDVVRRGKPLYRVDNTPVVLMYGSLAAYRELAPGVEGRDVKQLESNLKALGYGGFTVDDEYDWETAEAVQEWQDDLGLEETGRVELGRVVFRPSAVRVDSVEATAGQPAAPAQAVLTYTGTSRVVTVQMDVSDQRLAKEKAKVTIKLPDGKEAAGRIRDVYTVIQPAQGQGSEAETKIESIVSLSRKAARGLDAAAVDVTFTASSRKNVLTVPVSALVALSEGGYGVEVVSGGASKFVPVETGLFASGRVEVSGGDLAEGVAVGIPK
ncbi:peptidoglycan-binding protein [Sinosporangium album]|uniref:peptidoglycan-binding protein n=1 Tax=Sinosporangium album TaxID=504805 RepID=UPI001C40A665|nr:peptidoglycan-binding protein [Sinosporangium album]